MSWGFALDISIMYLQLCNNLCKGKDNENSYNNVLVSHKYPRNSLERPSKYPKTIIQNYPEGIIEISKSYPRNIIEISKNIEEIFGPTISVKCFGFRKLVGSTFFQDQAVSNRLRQFSQSHTCDQSHEDILMAILTRTSSWPYSRGRPGGPTHEDVLVAFLTRMSSWPFSRGRIQQANTPPGASLGHGALPNSEPMSYSSQFRP